MGNIEDRIATLTTELNQLKSKKRKRDDAVKVVQAIEMGCIAEIRVQKSKVSGGAVPYYNESWTLTDEQKEWLVKSILESIGE